MESRTFPQNYPSFGGQRTELHVLHLSRPEETLFTNGDKRKSGVFMGQTEGKTERRDERRDVRFKCLLLQLQVHVCRVHVYMCENKRGMHAIGLCRGASAMCARVCRSARVCSLSQHLNDIKALCKLSPWQLFRIPSPHSV